MKQFTIITKDGSKWLRVICPFKHGEDGWHDFYDVNPDIAYVGDHIEGTTLDESEVREVKQYRQIGAGIDWTTCPSEQVEKAATDRPSFELRIAYTDAESHGRHISDDYPGIDYQPLFNHMSKNHGLTLTTSEMDEIIGLSTYILAEK